MNNPFFKNYGPFKVKNLLEILKVNNLSFSNDELISDVKDLVTAEKKDLTFFHSKKYYQQAATTKAGYCLTLENLTHFAFERWLTNKDII